jgi:CxxC motif-containing protein (DUF1111 family)
MRAALPVLALLLALLVLARVEIRSTASAATEIGSPETVSLGAAAFHQRWVVAPSAFGAWGRGPTSNGEACSDCHLERGRGHPPESPDEPLRAGLLRLSIPGRDSHGAPLPHPAYGDQLQFEGVLGKVPGEGEVHVRWHTHAVALADGGVVMLRRPVIELRDLRFGPVGTETLRSLRIAPPLSAVGLLAAIGDRAILRQAQVQAALGLDGRPNLVWDLAAQRLVLGRFGWKANQPTLRQQIAGAFRNDLGVTSALFPDEDCPPVQAACIAFPHPPEPEVKPTQLDAIEAYLRAAMPPARPDPTGDVEAGARLFVAAGCNGCHAADLAHDRETTPLYSDLLLHDMGEGLSDGRPDFAAGPRDWRTAPLAGLGRDPGPFLHDGRARTLAEAILWHGGEAHPAHERFRTMVQPERAALLAFLSSL